MITLCNLQVVKDQKTLLRIEHMQIEEGEKTVIEGPNGSGKTTLLKVIAGLETRSAGSMTLGCQATEMTYVHQAPILFRGTVRHNLLCLKNSNHFTGNESDLQNSLMQWCKRLDVQQLLDQDVRHLSGGEKKKVALIRALLIRPKLLLVDEPFSDLDDDSSQVLIENLLPLKSVTILATTPISDERYSSFRRLKIGQFQVNESADCG